MSSSNTCICTGNVSYVAAQALGPSMTVLEAVANLTNTVNVSSNNANNALLIVDGVEVALDTVNTNIDIVYAAANDAFALASQANNTANAAYDQANTDHTLISGIFSTVFDEVIPSITVANDQANAAFDQANVATGIADSSFDRANLAYAAANTADSDAVLCMH